MLGHWVNSISECEGMDIIWDGVESNTLYNRQMSEHCQICNL